MKLTDLEKLAKDYENSKSDDKIVSGMYTGKAHAFNHCANKLQKDLDWLGLI